MVRIQWHERPFTIHRLVYNRGPWVGYDDYLDAVAAQFGLPTADDSTDPREGDFWIGVYPRAGWGDSDPDAIAWVGGFEVPVALAALKVAIDSHRRGAGPRPRRFTSADTPFVLAAAG